MSKPSSTMPFRQKKSASEPSNSVQTKLSVDVAYAKAVTHVKAEQYQDADQLCSAILKAYPNHIDAINLLGVIAQKINRHDLAVEQFNRAIEIDKHQAVLYYNLGTSLYPLGQIQKAIEALKVALNIEPENTQIKKYLEKIKKIQANNSIVNNQEQIFKKAFQQGVHLHQSGQLDKAINSYNIAVSIQPNNPAVLSNLGLALHSTGLLSEAITAYQKAITIQPDHAQAHYNLGNLLKEQKQNDKAIEHYKKAITIQPDYIDAYNNLGNTLKEQDKLDEAVAILEKASLLQPSSSNTLFNLGTVFFKQGALEKAVVCFNKAITIEPKHAQAHNNLGTTLQKQGELNKAYKSFKQALTIKPDYAQANCNIGDILTKQGKLTDAITYLQKAIKIQPNLAQAHNNYAVALHKLGKFTASIASCKKAISLYPDFAQAYFNIGVAFQDQGKLQEAIASFKQAVAIKTDYEDAHSNLLFCCQYIPNQTLGNLFEIHKKWASNLLSYQKTEIFSFDNDTSTNRRLRIALVSYDLGLHPVGYFVAGFLKHHKRNKFEIICYSDRKPDEFTKILQGYSDSWLNTDSMGDSELAQRIYDDKVDILIDLGGHTSKNRLIVFAKKPAPIQISWAGYVGTTGLPTMDYLIADKHYIKDYEDKYYTENIIRLPDSWVSYTPPPYAPKTVSKRSSRIFLGNFGNPTKINYKMLHVWSQILIKAPNTNLLLIYKGMDNHYTANRINSFFVNAGVDKNRIIISGQLSHPQLLAKYNEIDIALDTLPYSGGLTSFEALWMGVPVITTIGDTFAGRHSASILISMGLEKLVTNSFSEYIQLVLDLINDPEKLTLIKKDLHKKTKNSPLCDHVKFSYDLEKELSKAWQVWSKKQQKQKQLI
ncbi:MAG: tetratricopeptide repeat protein [Magnetococcales bacterium]|nr:tetratricopeptide repeat protein [Magnetococcales bacterium]